MRERLLTKIFKYGVSSTSAMPQQIIIFYTFEGSYLFQDSTRKDKQDLNAGYDSTFSDKGNAEVSISPKYDGTLDGDHQHSTLIDHNVCHLQ